MTTTPRIGSLFTGTGALDLAVQQVFGGTTVWHSQYEPPDKNGREDPHQYAAQILAHRFPGVPNLGDITKVDWQQVLDEHGPIDILTGGFPCTDVSSAGQRAGLIEGTRSGLWLQMAHAAAVLRPRLVVIENVEGLLSAKAASDVEPCAHCVGDVDREPPLRALGAVLGDLASLGFDAEWARVAASEVGAPHPRKRVFVLAWPAAVDAAGVGRRGGPRVERGLGAAGRGAEAAADAADFGHERRRGTRLGRPGFENRSVAAADTQSMGREGLRPEPAGCGPERGHPTLADADSLRRREAVLELRPGQPDVAWGDYEAAIHQWERVLGRRVPWPTDVRGRLTPVFSEWLMGLPDGHVTAVPGLPRSAMLRALGNGVVPQQAEAALRLLLARTTSAATAA